MLPKSHVCSSGRSLAQTKLCACKLPLGLLKRKKPDSFPHRSLFSTTWVQFRNLHLNPQNLSPLPASQMSTACPLHQLARLSPSVFPGVKLLTFEAGEQEGDSHNGKLLSLSPAKPPGLWAEVLLPGALSKHPLRAPGTTQVRKNNSQRRRAYQTVPVTAALGFPGAAKTALDGL